MPWLPDAIMVHRKLIMDLKCIQLGIQIHLEFLQTLLLILGSFIQIWEILFYLQSKTKEQLLEIQILQATYLDSCYILFSWSAISDKFSKLLDLCRLWWIMACKNKCICRKIIKRLLIGIERIKLSKLLNLSKFKILKKSIL